MKPLLLGLFFHQLLKEDEFIGFQNILRMISERRVIDGPDRHIWSLGSSGMYSVNSLAKHSATSLFDKLIFKALWKSKSPRHANILIYIYNDFQVLELLFDYPKEASILQLVSDSPSIFPLCMAESKDLQHLFFGCCFS